VSDFDFTCVWCDKPIEHGQTVLELRNGPYRDSRGEVDFSNSQTSFLHAGSGANKNEPDCLELAGVKALLRESSIVLDFSYEEGS